MNDGLDVRETIAFGLGPAETAALVVSLLSAYAVTRTGLAGAVSWTLAGLVGAGGAALAWGRLADRSLLGWSVRVAAYAWRRRASAAEVGGWVWAVMCAAAAQGRSLRAGRGWRPGGPGNGPFAAAWRRERGGVNVRPRQRRRSRASPAPTAVAGSDDQRAWRMAFFSLRGGTGRTTLACEVAAVLAARGHATDRSGVRCRPLRVVLADLDHRLPAATLRLGLPLPVAGDAGPRGSRAPAGWLTQHHRSGLTVVSPAHPGPLRGGRSPDHGEARLARLVADLDAGGADVIVLDLPTDLGAAGAAALRLCDNVAVVMTPTPAGLVDCYRSTAALRRLGLRDRLSHIVNRAHAGFDTTELLADLRIGEPLTVPEDPDVRAAEGSDIVAALDSDGPAGAALCELAAAVNRRVRRARMDEDACGDVGGRAG